MSQANTSTDGECDRNVRFEIVGDLVQTFKYYGAKHERTFNSSATSLDKCWNKSGRCCGTYSGGNLGTVTY